MKSGEMLYNMLREAMSDRGIEMDEWGELGLTEQLAWHDVAYRVSQEK